jgi:chaperone required for assembly of F1-ATPase
MPHAQPGQSLAALAAAVAAHDTFELVGLHELVTLSGSLVLGIAISRGLLDGATAWDLSRLDELWQAEHWGLDAEAEAAAARKAADFLRAEELLRHLRG